MTVKDRQRKEKKVHIVQAAAKVFAQKGFSRTVMADIAVEAGIGKGTIYEYFDSKEDLFFAVFQWFVHKIGVETRVRVSALGGSASERLEALNDSLINSWLEMEELYTLIMEFWAASSSSQMKGKFKGAFREGYSEFRHIVSALIRDGIDRGEFRSDVDAESVAAALVGTWDALLLQAWFDDAFDPFATARSFMSALIGGLKKEW
ncbi:MAG: TetR/AcrR family transcriptional regulator [Syntrophobacterales bacterium]|nr:MAG: TetR/AcrR family transcriptional regulator [Syntrophobacterales bacterium]